MDDGTQNLKNNNNNINNVNVNVNVNNDNNGNYLSWMYDPLLNIMMILLTMICYLLMQKCVELQQELNSLALLEHQQYGVVDPTTFTQVEAEL